MRWEYLAAVVISILIAGIFFILGRLDKHDAVNQAEQKGYDKGYREGQKDGRAQLMQESAINPFEERLKAVNRKAMPRPDSAGPIRVHRAVVRGDHRLPQNQDDRPRTNSVVKPPQTRITPGIPTHKENPSDPFDDGKRSAFD